MAGKSEVTNPKPPIKNNQSKGAQTPSVNGPAVGHTSGNATKSGAIAEKPTSY